MKVQAFPSGPFDTNAYVVVCEISNEAAIVDPAPGCAENIKTYLAKNNYIPNKILLTHSHWDHIADTAIFKTHYQLPVFVHHLDAPNLESPGTDRLPCWITIQAVKPDGFLMENEEVMIGRGIFTIIHTPGHSPGSLCLYNEKDHLLLSGDTLFHGSIGNLSFPTSQPELMAKSLEKLAILPGNTKVYPGHGPSTTIAKETWLPNAKQIFNL